MHPSSIPFARAEALALDLPEQQDRVLAFKWLGKLKELQNQELKEPGVWTDVVGHITTMLIECLDRKFLIGPFKMMPPAGLPDSLEWKKYQPGDMAALIRQQQKTEQGGGGEQPMTTHVAPNIRQYLVHQEVPKFGVQFYYAFSKDPITEWENADLAYLDDGTPFVESEHSQDTSLLERSRYIEADEIAKKARKAEPKELKIEEGDSPETIKFKKLPPHLRQRQLQREAEEAATKDLNLTPIAFKARSKPPYTHSYKPEMFGLTQDEQFESADTFFHTVEWDPEGRHVRPVPEDAHVGPAHPYLGVPAPDLKKYEDYERFEREIEERQMLMDPRPRWLSPTKRAHFERIQTIRTQKPPTLDLSAINVEIEPDERQFTRIEWEFDDSMPEKVHPAPVYSPVMSTESSETSSIDDILSETEMETGDMFDEDQLAVPVAPHFEPRILEQPDIQKILASIRKSHGVDDEMLESIETEILNNSVSQQAAPEDIFEQSLQDFLPTTPPSVKNLIGVSQRRSEGARRKIQERTRPVPLRDQRPEDKRKMVAERLAAIRQTKPKVVEDILVEISPETLSEKRMEVQAEEYAVSPRKYIQTLHAKMVEDGDENLDDMEAPSFEDYLESEVSSSDEDLDKLEMSLVSSSSDEFDDLQVKLPQQERVVEDYDIPPIITAEQMAAEAQRFQRIKKNFIRQKFEPMKLKLDYQLLEENIEEAVEMLQQDLLDPEISEMFTDALTILDQSIEELVIDEPMLQPPPSPPDAEQLIEDFEDRLNEIYKVRELKHVPELLDTEMETFDFEGGAAGVEEELQKWKKTPVITVSPPLTQPRVQKSRKMERDGQRSRFAKKLFDVLESTPSERKETQHTVETQPKRVQKTTETLVTVDEEPPSISHYVPKDDGLTPSMRLKKLLDQIHDEGMLNADAILEDEEINLYQEEVEDVIQDGTGRVRVEVKIAEQVVYQQQPDDNFDWLGPLSSPPKPRRVMPTPAAPRKAIRGHALSAQPSRTKVPMPGSAMKTPKVSSRMTALAKPKVRGAATTTKPSRLESLAAPKKRGVAVAKKPVKLTRSKSSLDRSGRA